VCGFFALKIREAAAERLCIATPVNRGFAEVPLIFLQVFPEESSFVGGAADRYRCPPASRCLAGAGAHQVITPRFSDEPTLFVQ